jgi:phosphinothricin acetyltransferase
VAGAGRTNVQLRDTDSMDSGVVRTGEHEDLRAVLNIYNHHVEAGDATFDLRPLSMSEGEAWMQAFAATGPHQLLLVDHEGEVLGYATSSPYRSHPAFSQTVETSIYLRPDAQGRGLAGRLYDVLLGRLASSDAHMAVAGVALPNDASIALHRSRGFTEVGTFTEYAIKNGRRISSTWFERPIAVRASVS